MSAFRRFFVLFAVLFAASCSLGEPPEVKKKFDEAHDAILARDTAYFRANFLPQAIRDQNFDEAVASVWNAVPEGKFLSRRLAGWQWTSDTSGGSVYARIYQYRFEQGYAAVTIAVVNRTDGPLFSNLKVIRLNTDLIAHHDFRLVGKPLASYAFLGLMILAVALSVGALVRIIAMRKRLRRPVRWAIFVLVGFYLFTINWTTGEITPQHLYAADGENVEISFPNIGLLSAGFVRDGLFAPWILEVYIPLGALLFWLQTMRGRLALREILPGPGEAPPAAGSGTDGGPEAGD